MDKEKFKNLMSEKEFVKKIMKMQAPEEVQNFFKEQGVEISIEEIGALGDLINKLLRKGDQPLTEQELQNITGGKVSTAAIAGAYTALMIGSGALVGWWYRRRYEKEKRQKVLNKINGKATGV